MTNETRNLESLDATVLECDRHHYFYHYKSSYQHLCFAEYLKQLGNLEQAREHYAAALFQDHQNEWAKHWENRTEPATYDMHIKSGAIEALAAYEASLGWEADSSMELCTAGKYADAIAMSAARHHAYHQHASAAHVARGIYYMQAAELDLAIADFSKALDLWRENAEALALKTQCQSKRQAEERE